MNTKKRKKEGGREGKINRRRSRRGGGRKRRIITKGRRGGRGDMKRTQIKREGKLRKTKELNTIREKKNEKDER